MTAQSPDSILLQGDSFDVTAIDGTSLFDPGAQPDEDGHSCHYRGLNIPVAFTGRLLIGADVIPNPRT